MLFTFLFAYLLHCIVHSPDVLLTVIKQMKKKSDEA